MKSENKISIIIPTFNRESSLIRAIDSVLAQTYKDFELIIIDDGSTDNTKKIITNYENIKYIYQTNKGVSAARNLGVENCDGKYIAFLDSDDEWHPEKLEKQMNLISKSQNLKAVHTDEVWIRNDVRVNQPKRFRKGGGDQFMACLDHCIIAPSSILIEKVLFTQLGRFNESYAVCEDYDLWLKLTSLYQIGYIPEDLIIKYGGHEDQLSTKFVAMDYWRIKSLDWIMDYRKLSSEQREQVQKVLVRKCVVLLKGYLKHKNLDNFDEIKHISNKYNQG